MSTSTAPRDHRPVESPRWASVSASLILPFGRELAEPEAHPDEDSVVGWTTERWTLKGLQDHTSFFDASRSPTVRDRSRWFSSPRFHHALEEVQYAHLPAAHARNGRLTRLGIAVKCVERRIYDEVGFLIIHLALERAALEDPETVFRALRRPYSPVDATSPLADSLPEVRAGLEEVISLSGLSAPPDEPPDVRLGISKGGFISLVNSRGFAVGRGHAHRTYLRPFLVAHLAPSREISTRPATAAGLDKWEPAEAWAFAVSSGIGAGRSLISEPNTVEAARRCSGWLHRTLVRASEHGIALVGTDPASAKSREDSDIEALSHGPVVDLAVLAMRQRRFLLSHAEQLADVASRWSQDTAVDPIADVDRVLEDADKVQRRALGLDTAFVLFRNTTWFTSVPGRVEGTSLLLLLQAGLGTDELITEVVEKQADLSRVLDQVATIREREDQNRRAEEAEERDRLSLVVGVGAAVLAPSALVFGAAALVTQPSVTLFWVSLGAALLLSAPLVVAVLTRNRRRRAG